MSESDDVKEYLKAKQKVEKLASEMGHSVNVQTSIYDVNKPSETKPETSLNVEVKPKRGRNKKE